MKCHEACQDPHCTKRSENCQWVLPNPDCVRVIDAKGETQVLIILMCPLCGHIHGVSDTTLSAEFAMPYLSKEESDWLKPNSTLATTLKH
jgi:hypothetical protein